MSQTQSLVKYIQWYSHSMSRKTRKYFRKAILSKRKRKILSSNLWKIRNRKLKSQKIIRICMKSSLCKQRCNRIIKIASERISPPDIISRWRGYNGADNNDYRIIGVSSRDSILPPAAERGWFSIPIENHDQINYRSNRIIGRFVERLPCFNGRRCNVFPRARALRFLA